MSPWKGSKCKYYELPEEVKLQGMNFQGRSYCMFEIAEALNRVIRYLKKRDKEDNKAR